MDITVYLYLAGSLLSGLGLITVAGPDIIDVWRYHKILKQQQAQDEGRRRVAELRMRHHGHSEARRDAFSKKP